MNKALSLFSGIGAHDLGLHWAGWDTQLFCEIDPYCRQVLKKHWPHVDVISDISTLRGGEILARFKPDLLTGGFPCQDISTAGRGAGLDGQKSGLFFHIVRLLQEMRHEGHVVPWLLLENVPALYTRGYDRVADALEGEGYQVWPSVVGASNLGAPHKRQRVWIVGVYDPLREGCPPQCVRGQKVEEEGPEFDVGDSNTLLADTGQVFGGKRHDKQLQEAAPIGRSLPVQHQSSSPRFCWPSRPYEVQHDWEWPRTIDRAGTKEIESLLGITTHGPPRRVARLKALGNCNPPHVPYLIGKWMLEHSK